MDPGDARPWKYAGLEARSLSGHEINFLSAQVSGVMLYVLAIKRITINTETISDKSLLLDNVKEISLWIISLE